MMLRDVRLYHLVHVVVGVVCIVLDLLLLSCLARIR